MNWIEEKIDQYYSFLKENTITKDVKVNGWYEISTPFLDMYNDTIEIYVKNERTGILLSDDGVTLRNLRLSGVNIPRSKIRKDFLNKVLINYGIELTTDDELIVQADEHSFPQKKLNLLSAISEINDFSILSKNKIACLFAEDVSRYFDDLELVYTPHFISRGSTGLEFTFDFQIAYKNQEILIKAFNSVNKINLPQFLFTWDDVRTVRENQTKKKINGLAIINDESKDVKPDYLEALTKKESQYILWSERNHQPNIRKLKLTA